MSSTKALCNYSAALELILFMYLCITYLFIYLFIHLFIHVSFVHLFAYFYFSFLTPYTCVRNVYIACYHSTIKYYRYCPPPRKI